MHQLRLTVLGRFAATVLALLWCVQPLSLLVHAESHAHHFCVEHGAFEDGGPEAVSSSSTARPAQVQMPEFPEPLPDEPSHEACALATSMTREVLAPAAGVFVLPSATAPPEGLLAETATLRSSNLLHVAPKGSPPAARTLSFV